MYWYRIIFVLIPCMWGNTEWNEKDDLFRSDNIAQTRKLCIKPNWFYNTCNVCR